jgi:hypothetical protein
MGVRLAIRRGKDVVVAVTVPALGEIWVLPYLQAAVLPVDLGLVFVAPPTVDRLDVLPVRILRLEIQVLHADRFVTRVAVLVAVARFGEELVRRSASLIVGLTIVAIRAFLGRGVAFGPAGLLGTGAAAGRGC